MISKPPLQNFYQTAFHTAALWGAITFVRELCGDKNISNKQVVEVFSKYLGYDENTLSVESALVAYHRLNLKIRGSIGKDLVKDKVLFQSEVLTELIQIRDILDPLLDITRNMTCNVDSSERLIDITKDGNIFLFWIENKSDKSISYLAKKMSKHRSSFYQMFKSDQFAQATWDLLRTIGYTKKIKNQIIDEQKQANIKSIKGSR